MPPQEPYRPGPQAQRPQEPFAPHSPHYGYEGPQPTVGFQQHENGQYEVLPPLPSAQNDGHSGHNPYDFIMSPNARRAKSGFSLGTGNTVFIRLGIIVGAVVVLFIIGAIIMSSLAPKGATPGLLSIAERQQEIVRVSTEAAKQATTSDGQNFLTNVEMTVTSSQGKTLSLLSSHGVKPSQTELALDKDSATDTELANAAAANNYDAAATQNLVGQLQGYQSLLQSTYKLATTDSTKSLLQSEFNGVSLLLQQARNLLAELE
jgi:hypothetical protein